MIHKAPAEKSWSRTTWWLLFATVMGAQLLLILWLSPPPNEAAAPQIRVLPRIHFHADPKPKDLPSWEFDGHPGLFALLHPKGFSGNLWAKRPRYKPTMAGFVEPPLWLTQRLDRIGKPFGHLVKRQIRPPLVLAKKPAPNFSELQAVHPASNSKTTLSSAGFPNRTLLFHPALPLLNSTNLVRPSVVRVGVDPEGRPRAYRIIRKSDWPEANSLAVRLAKQARFTPAPAASIESLDFGELTYTWQIQLVPPRSQIGEP